MVIAVALLAAAAITPLPNNAQLTCSLIGSGETAATMVDIDTRARKGPNAVLRVAGFGPYARVSATTPVARLPDGTSAISFATGNGRYRLELMPRGDTIQARLALVSGAVRPTVAQGFCSERKGKRLPKAKFATETPDLAVPARPWKLQPLPSRLPDMVCRLIGPDRRLHEVRVKMGTAQGTEVAANYSFTTTDLLGAPQAFGSGTQFYLVAPAERLVATTVQLSGQAPSFYMHTTYERLGNWVDLSRDNRMLAVGSCGQPLPFLDAAPGANR